MCSRRNRNLRGVYVQTNLVFVSHKNINSGIAVSQSVYCPCGNTAVMPGIVNCFNIVLLVSEAMKRNLV